MQGLKRRIIFVALYEGFAVGFVSLGLDLMSTQGLASSSALAVASSAIAVAWNLLFNLVFEAWESRQPERTRSLVRRLVHAIAYEGGLATLLVPFLAWWLGVAILEAMAIDFVLLGFFLIYTFVFNWVFDRIFGLPAAVTDGRHCQVH